MTFKGVLFDPFDYGILYKGEVIFTKDDIVLLYNQEKSPIPVMLTGAHNRMSYKAIFLLKDEPFKDWKVKMKVVYQQDENIQKTAYLQIKGLQFLKAKWVHRQFLIQSGTVKDWTIALTSALIGIIGTLLSC